MITENASILKINKLTQAQYDRELAAGRIDENALYLTPDTQDFLPLSGGTLTGQLNVSGGDGSINLVSTNEGGNLQIYSPSSVGGYWEMDAYNGNLRVYRNNGGNVEQHNSFPATSGTLLNTSDLYKGTFNSGNLDELRTKGIYWTQFNSSNVSGTTPNAGSYGFLEILGENESSTTGCMQRWTNYENGGTHVRSYINSKWTSWVKLGGGTGSWTYTKVVDSKYVGTVSTPVSSHQYFTAKGTVNGNVFTNTINLGDIGLWGSKSFSFAHGSSSCNFDITASSIKVTANGSVDDVSGYYMDK